MAAYLTAASIIVNPAHVWRCLSLGIVASLVESPHASHLHVPAAHFHKCPLTRLASENVVGLSALAIHLGTGGKHAIAAATAATTCGSRLV